MATAGSRNDTGNRHEAGDTAATQRNHTKTLTEGNRTLIMRESMKRLVKDVEGALRPKS